MDRVVGTVSRGLRTPIIKEGDDIECIVVDTVLGAEKAGEFKIGDKDVLAVTEAVVARAQGNYATVDQIAADVRTKLGDGTIGLVFPILSRNRFATCLTGIAKAAKKLIIMLSYPSDEVGNHLIDLDKLDESGVNPYTDLLTQEEFEMKFGKSRHPFTDMDYIGYYREVVESAGAESEIVLCNDPRKIAKYAENVLVCDVHTRERTKRILNACGVPCVLGLDDILTSSVDGSGFNEDYGLLGSNRATDEKVKLFPTGCREFAENVQARIFEATGKTVEVMVYGDGAFKDPVGKIWELADPVVSPGYTKGLEGQPNELKIKYLADNDFKDLSGDELKEAISKRIKEKTANLGDAMEAQGTTPRRLTDLIGSLCDLTSGSGDKGTPVVYIQGYFDNYSS